MVTTFYPPYSFGGDGMFIYRLVNELAGRGHRVDVVHCLDAYRALHRGAAPSPRDYPHAAGVTVHALSSGAGILSPLVTHQTGHPGFNAPRLRAILRDGRFDVVHYHNMSLVGPAALAYGGGIKLYTMHEHWLVCPLHVLWKFNRTPCTRRQCLPCTVHGRRPPQLWRYTGSLNRAVSHVDAFIAVSRFSRDKHREMGFPQAARVEHIPYFVPPADARGAPDDAPPHPRPYYLVVGRLEKMKGVQAAIEAARDRRDVDLLVVGDGGYQGTLRRLAAGLSHVHFLGRLPYSRLQAFFRHAVALIVPSIGYETFGIVMLEAFVQRTPVIVNNLGALPEVVEQSGGGLVYDDVPGLRRAMEALRSNDALRRSLGDRGYEAYRRYWTPEAHLRQYFGLIRELAVRKGAPLDVPEEAHT